MTIDRSEVNRALAKALAFKQCGQDAKAAQWARMLIQLLECSEILTPDRGAGPKGWDSVEGGAA